MKLFELGLPTGAPQAMPGTAQTPAATPGQRTPGNGGPGAATANPADEMRAKQEQKKQIQVQIKATQDQLKALQQQLASIK